MVEKTPHRALVEHRPWLLASLAAGVAYYLLWNNPIAELWLIALKGASVALLAVYTLRRASGGDAAILALALALSSAGDMALVLIFEVGGALFFASHVAALALYARNRASETTGSQKACAAALFIATPLLSYLLSGRMDIAAYSLALAAMAASAWMSRFPRSRVGLGAILFLISDWLIFSRFGPLDLTPLPDILVWPTYYIAQFLIATGVVQTLRADREAPEAFA